MVARRSPRPPASRSMALGGSADLRQPVLVRSETEHRGPARTGGVAANRALRSRLDAHPAAAPIARADVRHARTRLCVASPRARLDLVRAGRARIRLPPSRMVSRAA